MEARLEVLVDGKNRLGDNDAMIRLQIKSCGTLREVDIELRKSRHVPKNCDILFESSDGWIDPVSFSNSPVPWAAGMPFKVKAISSVRAISLSPSNGKLLSPAYAFWMDTTHHIVQFFHSVCTGLLSPAIGMRGLGNNVMPPRDAFDRVMGPTSVIVDSNIRQNFGFSNAEKRPGAHHPETMH